MQIIFKEITLYKIGKRSASKFNKELSRGPMSIEHGIFGFTFWPTPEQICTCRHPPGDSPNKKVTKYINVPYQKYFTNVFGTYVFFHPRMSAFSVFQDITNNEINRGGSL